MNQLSGSRGIERRRLTGVSFAEPRGVMRIALGIAAASAIGNAERWSECNEAEGQLQGGSFTVRENFHHRPEPRGVPTVGRPATERSGSAITVAAIYWDRGGADSARPCRGLLRWCRIDTTVVFDLAASRKTDRQPART